MKMADRARLFISRAKTLQTRRLWRDPTKFRTTLDLPEQVELDFTNVFVNVLPDEEEALALLVSFRPFILPGEPIQLGEFYRRAIESIRCSRSQTILRASKTRWKRLRDDWPAVLHFGGKNIRAHQGLRLWMYGYIFHNEPENFQILDAMPQGMRDALKIQALHYVLATTVEISRISRILERAVRKGLLVEEPE